MVKLTELPTLQQKTSAYLKTLNRYSIYTKCSFNNVPPADSMLNLIVVFIAAKQGFDNLGQGFLGLSQPLSYYAIFLFFSAGTKIQVNIVWNEMYL